jgi:choline dehydrogenase-like flavoprotein
MGDIYNVIIVGSGIGELISTALLAREGFKVHLLEQNLRLGGCCSAYQKNEYTFNVGAVFVLYREVLIGQMDKLNDYCDEFHARGLMARADDLPLGLTSPSFYDPKLAPESATHGIDESHPSGTLPCILEISGR